MSNFKLNNDLLRKIVSRQLEKKKAASNKLSTSYVEGMIQEEVNNVIDEMFGRTDERYQGEGAAPNMLEWWKEDPDKIMSFVYWLKGQLPPSDPEKKQAAWDNLVQQLEKRHPSPSGIQEGMPHEISYSDVRKEYDAILGFLKDDLLKRVGSKYLADALELLSSDVRDGVHDPKSGTAWDDENLKEARKLNEGIVDDIQAAWDSWQIPGPINALLDKSEPLNKKVDDWFKDNMGNPGVRLLYKLLMSTDFGMTPDTYRHDKNWEKEQSAMENLVNEEGEEEAPEEAPETGTGEQRDAAKEQGFKPDVVKVAKFMFKHKQLGPALGKLKGDKIESAQLMVLLAQELGIEAGDLQKMQVQMKAAMTKAEK